MVDLAPVKSSNIKGVGYDASKQELHIDFGKGAYVYQGVSPKDHADLMAAESAGKHFHANIRGKFETRKPGGESDRDR